MRSHVGGTGQRGGDRLRSETAGMLGDSASRRYRGRGAAVERRRPRRAYREDRCGRHESTRWRCSRNSRVAAAGAGAVLHEHAEVRRLIIEPHPVEPHPVLELEGAVIRPRFVIVAVNAWTSHLLPSIRQVESSLTFACATEPLSDSTLDDIGLGRDIPFYTVDTPYLWGRADPRPADDFWRRPDLPRAGRA